MVSAFAEETSLILEQLPTGGKGGDYLLALKNNQQK